MDVLNQNEPQEGLEWLKKEGYKNTYFPEIKRSLAEIVILSDAERAKITRPIKKWEGFPKLSWWEERNLKAYLRGEKKNCLGWE